MKANISKTITKEIAKKIWKKEDAFEALNLAKVSYKKNDDPYLLISKFWEYELFSKIIRYQYKKNDKYEKNKNSLNLLEHFSNLYRLDSKLEWPFSQDGFEKYIQDINNNLSYSENDYLKKELEIAINTISYRRIKHLNTLINDYLEYYIIENNEKIIPTLKHSSGVDYFIDGEAFDQKVSRSVGNAFKNKYSDNWKAKAESNPELVLESLLENQSDERFGSDPRLYIVYINETKFIDTELFKEKLRNLNFSKPYNVAFNTKKRGEHICKCFIIYL